MYIEFPWGQRVARMCCKAIAMLIGRVTEQCATVTDMHMRISSETWMGESVWLVARLYKLHGVLDLQHSMIRAGRPCRDLNFDSRWRYVICPSAFPMPVFALGASEERWDMYTVFFSSD